MPLCFTPLLRLKRCHACDQWHSSRASTFLHVWHCKLGRTTEGLQQYTGVEDVVQAVVTIKHFLAYSIEDYTEDGVHAQRYLACLWTDNLHSRMPLVSKPARLKRAHACGQCHSSRTSTAAPLTSDIHCCASYRCHRKLCHNTLKVHDRCESNPNPNPMSQHTEGTR
jgi:hypothetical protein